MYRPQLLNLKDLEGVIMMKNDLRFMLFQNPLSERCESGPKIFFVFPKNHEDDFGHICPANR